VLLRCRILLAIGPKVFFRSRFTVSRGQTERKACLHTITVGESGGLIMSRFSSTAVFAGAICVCLGLITSGALAQEADPSEPIDTTVEEEWMPKDGRPGWSNNELDTTTESGTGWQPTYGLPPWANNPPGQPEWAGRPSQDATSLQSSRGGFASGHGNRGRGRNR
jgi:hypothetical protein